MHSAVLSGYGPAVYMPFDSTNHHGCMALWQIYIYTMTRHLPPTPASYAYLSGSAVALPM